MSSTGNGAVPTIPEIAAIPELAPIVPLILAKRALAGLGFREENTGPVLINTETARKLWPILQPALGPMPHTGAANYVGLLVVWSPALDHVVAPR